MSITTQKYTNGMLNTLVLKLGILLHIFHPLISIRLWKITKKPKPFLGSSTISYRDIWTSLEGAYVSEIQKLQKLWKCIDIFIISHIHTVLINLRGDFITLQSRYLARKYFLNSFLDSSPTSSWSRLRPYFRHFLEANWHKPSGPSVTSVTQALRWAHTWKKRALGPADKLGLWHSPCSAEVEDRPVETVPGQLAKSGAPSCAFWSSDLGGLFMETWWTLWMDG